jgi:hypothetical protein
MVQHGTVALRMGRPWNRRSHLEPLQRILRESLGGFSRSRLGSSGQALNRTSDSPTSPGGASRLGMGRNAVAIVLACLLCMMQSEDESREPSALVSERARFRLILEPALSFALGLPDQPSYEARRRGWRALLLAPPMASNCQTVDARDCPPWLPSWSSAARLGTWLLAIWRWKRIAVVINGSGGSIRKHP